MTWKSNLRQSMGVRRHISLVACVLTMGCAVLSAAPFGNSQTNLARTATRTDLTVDSVNAAGQTQARLSVSVHDATGNPVNEGTVSFLSGKEHLGLGSAIVKRGEASLTVNGLPASSQQITAVYDGDDAYGRSISSPASVEANATALPDFVLTASPTSLTVTNGSYGNVIVTATPQGGFNLPVSLSCSGLLLPTTCTFNPTLLVTTGGASSSTMQIQTELPSPALATPLEPFGGGRHLAYALLAPGLLTLAGLAGVRKRAFRGLRVLGIVALLGACTLGISACSPLYTYNHHPPTKNPGTVPGVYTVTISGFANNGGSVTSHTVPVVLTVK
jgi:hypothetical protein